MISKTEADGSANAFESDKPDTAKRDLAQEAIEGLRERGGVFVEAVRATRMAMALTDPNLPGNPIVFANKSFVELSGYTLDEALGQQPFFMNGADTDPDDVVELHRALEEDRDGNLETIQYRKNGSRFVANVLLSAFKDEDGGTLYHFLSWQDVTRRTDAEAEVTKLQQARARLRESEENYRVLFEAIDEGFCVIEVIFDEHGASVDYRFVQINPAFERQTGLPDAVGRTMREMAPDHESHWFDTYGRIALTGEPARFEEEAAALGRWYDVYAFRVGKPEQRQVAILFRDILQRKLGEQALRESEERYEALFAASPVPFMVLAPNAPDFPITAANKAYFAATLTTPETLVGRRLFDVFPDDPSRPGQLGSEALAISLDRVLTTRTTDAMERVRYDLVVPGGFEPHWWEAINAPMLDGSGEVTAIIHQVTRVTELHYAEQAQFEEQERQAFLLKLSDALRAEPSAEAMTERALRMLLEQMRLNRCYVGIYRLAEDVADLPHQVHDDRLPPLPAQVRLSDFPEALQVAFDRTLVIDDVAETEGLSNSERASFDGLGMRALIAATLRKGETNPLWAVVAVSTCARVWTQSEVALVEEVAERTWAAVERARADEARRESDERYRLLFESIDSGFCVIEMIFGPDGRAIDYRFIEANTAFERQSGLVDAVGRRIREFAPDLEEHWFERYGRVALTGESMRVEGEVAPLGRWFDINAYRIGTPEQRRVAVLFTDISDRKHAEAALRTSQEQFETLLNQAPLGVYLVDGDFVIRQVNPIAMPVFGDIPGGPIGRNFDDIIHILWEKNYADEVVSIFRHTLETGKPYVTAERAEQRSDRDIIEYYEWRIDRITLPDGRHGVVCYFRDISAQVHARQEIEKGREFARESEERLRLIVESARDYAIFTTDKDGVINDWLAGAQAVFGYSREEAEGQPAAILFTQEDRAHHEPEEEVETARREGKAADVRWHVRKDGGRVFIEGQVVPLRQGNGEIHGFLKIGQDITDRQLAEEALRVSEARFRQFGDASSDLLWIRNAETLAFEYLSPAFETLYGMPRERVLEANNVKAWAELIHPDDQDLALNLLRKLREGVPMTSEFRVIHPVVGEVRWIHDSSFPIVDERGVVERIAGIGQDVTERKRAVELQGTLLAELQHRVRNILAMIQSVVGRTLDTSESVEDYAMHLGGRIAAMARTQAVITRSAGRRVDLEDMIRDELLSAAAQEAQYWCEGPTVALSPKAAEVLTLAVHELATNATKYGSLSKRGGQLEISWQVEDREGRQWLVFRWGESRVGKIRPFTREGFGTELITRRVPYELRGSGSLRPSGSGIEACIEFPLEAGSSIFETGAMEQIE